MKVQRFISFENFATRLEPAFDWFAFLHFLDDDMILDVPDKTVSDPQALTAIVAKEATLLVVNVFTMVMQPPFVGKDLRAVRASECFLLFRHHRILLLLLLITADSLV